VSQAAVTSFRFRVLRIFERINAESKACYTHVICGECQQPIEEPNVLIVCIVTVKSEAEFNVFIHDACYSSKVLAGETCASEDAGDDAGEDDDYEEAA
jgi:hypothetical protein